MPMAPISLEDIGADYRIKAIGLFKSRAWVARIKAISGHMVFREFLRAFIDHSHSNSVGSRGIYKNYMLEESGVYEISQPCTWKRTKRYFCRVEGGKIIEMEQEEAARWLNTHSA